MSEEQWTLEDELEDIEAELEILYGLERNNQPYVDDRVRGVIYGLQARRDEIKTRLGINHE